ncbi:hypothetical protein ERJ70_15745 [Sediminibacillus dalangtanensis]|uniref:WD40-like Beta Propeller Repeat n=1 Tax=Sediminibacillus dalangtanensis TaxID=2729421 RepID=A0ABX7VYE3_9BACI|nr:PD40 domain-containing protein [Sediminibacillus dalangtanensis]QTN00619.1 hypothetical protein ERJ70_15745 [Sediminibacillus dalangtanensis]
MKKKGIWALLIAIAIVTIFLVILGVVFGKEEFEKQQGLTGIYDISPDGSIAYVYFDEGHPGIYFENDSHNPNEPLVELSIDQEILDISFSPDGSSFTYVTSGKDKQAGMASSVHKYYPATNHDEELFNGESLITEIEFDPKDSDTLYFLQAGTFESYSPIASAHPHDFDVFSFDLSSGKTERHTDLKKYNMKSLKVSSREQAVFWQMDDDMDTETADDIFESHQRIFKLPLDDNGNLQALSAENRQEDVFDFALTPDEQTILFQAVSNADEGGTFEYELFSYDRETKEESQLTTLKHSVSNVIMGPEGRRVYFMVDKKFGQQQPDYHLYSVDLNGKNSQEEILYMKSSKEG